MRDWHSWDLELRLLTIWFMRPGSEMAKVTRALRGNRAARRLGRIQSGGVLAKR